MHSVYLLCVLFLFPESLSVPRQLDARKRHQVESQSATDRAKLQDEEAKDAGLMAVLSNKGSRAFEGLFWFAKPLALLLPKKRGSWEKEEDRPILESRGAVKEGWDWELTKVAIAYASYVMVTVSRLNVILVYKADSCCLIWNRQSWHLNFFTPLSSSRGDHRKMDTTSLSSALVESLFCSSPFPYSSGF